MKVEIYCQNSSQHQKPCAEAFHSGLQKHNVNSRLILTTGYTPKDVDADLVVFWGAGKTGLVKSQIAKNRDYLIMERGYFLDRMKWYSLGFNGLNGRGEMYNRDCPSDRWEPHKHLMKPWRGAKGKYVLLMGQMPGDRSHVGIVKIKDWYGKITKEIESKMGMPVLFRPHPSDPHYRGSKPSLDEQLKDAYCAATFNSNAAVDTIMKGIPTLCFNHTSMAYPVCVNSLDNISKLNEEPDRETWANNLAYCQWNLKEIADGKAWEHLKQRYK